MFIKALYTGRFRVSKGETMNKQFKCPEVTFFEVYQQEKTVKIDGELVYRDGELELIQYTNCYLDYEKLDQKGYIGKCRIRRVLI